MLKCTDCDELNAWDDTLTHTWLQWQCCACGQWIDWKPGEYDELHEEYKMTRKVGNALIEDFQAWAEDKPLSHEHVIAMSDALKATQQGNSEVEQVVEHMFKERNGEVWDLRDEDGDLHSPVWYLEAWMSSQLAYAEALTVHHDDPDKDELHMQRLDDMQTEVDMYARYVNKLFRLLR